jgi:hypothetical protein
MIDDRKREQIRVVLDAQDEAAADLAVKVPAASP